MLDHNLPNRSADEPFPFKPREGPMTDRTQEPGESDGGSGDMLCNSMMKCETKAKRRVTLSICGLGMLDETEIETIPGAAHFDELTSDNRPINTDTKTAMASAGVAERTIDAAPCGAESQDERTATDANPLSDPKAFKTAVAKALISRKFPLKEQAVPVAALCAKAKVKSIFEIPAGRRNGFVFAIFDGTFDATINAAIEKATTKNEPATQNTTGRGGLGDPADAKTEKVEVAS